MVFGLFGLGFFVVFLFFEVVLWYSFLMKVGSFSFFLFLHTLVKCIGFNSLCIN